jgi:hypothetical protein
MQKQVNTTPWTRGGNLTGEKYILPLTKSSERALIKQKVKMHGNSCTTTQ